MPPSAARARPTPPISRHNQSPFGTQGNAVIRMPPSTARARPTPPPKPKKRTDDYKHTGTQI